MARKILLGCGIVSSALYVAADIVAARRYEGYSYTDYTFSELFAAGAPTRPLMVGLVGIPYNLLVAACGVGVSTSAGATRAARVSGALLVGYAAAGMAGGVIFPTTPRGIEGTLRNTMHIPATAVMSLCVMLSMGFGATLLGRRFRSYTYGTIVTLIVFGGLTSVQAGRLRANEPTPWMGIEERINIYATMLWIGVLAVALPRAHGQVAPGHMEPRTTTRRTMQGVPR